jgi:hypothetical protein
MMPHHDAAGPKKEILNLLFVLGGAVAFACILGYILLTFYGPSGAYSIQNVLLSPETIDKISYTDTNSRTGAKTHFSFDKIEYSRFDEETKAWKKKELDIQTYETFYGLIAKDKSLAKPSDDVIVQFSGGLHSHLSVLVRSLAKSDRSTTKAFQEVQFADNYYRVELRMQGAAAEWAYYYHPSIAKEVFSLFGSKN